MNGVRLRTCGACGTAGQADTASFCFACGGSLAAPGCTSCGADLPAGARFCPSCGSVQDGSPESPVTAEAPAPRSAARKITSVLFGDLVGFTTLSESRDPEEVRELLTAYFDECRAVVDRYGGELEKFIGDAVMAVWGLPVTREDDAERAVRAGLELVERVTALGDRIAMPGLAMRVGITTAEVAVTLGATGQGMVAGDAVNTAARIQSTAPPGEVWVDETTRSLSSSAIAFDDAGAHAMKGKAEPVPLWAVRTVVAGVGGDGRDDGLEGQLIGRDRELRLVKEAFHRVEETLRPGLLVVNGEPGTGKSRLAWEFEKYVDGLDASVLWHRGRCLSYGEGVAYYALAEAVRGRLAILAGGDSTSTAELDSRALLRAGLLACLPEPEEREWLEPRLAALLGLDSDGSFPREDLFVAWTAFFKYAGLWQNDAPTAQPVVLVIDDAQYADEGLLDFLEHLLAAADYPVFVLVLARPELLAEHPALVGNRRVTVVHLEPLPPADMTRLLDELVHGLPETVRGELVARAEGIPLYAIETVRSMLDQDLVVVHDGHYVLADPEAVNLTTLTAPASLQALIAARLDTLPADERRVVDSASVLGLVFTETGITALCADHVPDLDRCLAALVRREVFRRDTDRLSADYGGYRFVQGAVRQVAYGMLARRDRKATHLTVARAFEVELEARSDAYELAPIIAQHYLDAIDAVPADPDVTDLTRVASDHLERAADRSAALGAPREAVGHLTMALARCEPERRFAIQSRLARQLLRAGDHRGAIEHAAEALKGLDAAGDVLAAAGPAEDLAKALVYSGGDLRRAESVVQEQLERLPDTADALPARMGLVTALAAVKLRLGDAVAIKQTAEESVRLAERSGDPRQIADSWITFAIACSTSGLPRLSVSLLENAATLAAEHRALRVRGIALVNLAAYTVLDDLPAAIRHAREAVAAGREIGDGVMGAFARSHLAHGVLFAAGWDEIPDLVSGEEIRSIMKFEIDLVERQVAIARSEALKPLEQDPESIEDPGMQAMHSLAIALDAHGAGQPGAVGLALDSLHPSPSADEFWLSWLFASEILCESGDGDAIAALLAHLDARTDPLPTALSAQRSRLLALAGQDGSLADEAIEAAFSEALDFVRAWGSALFEAHIAADYGGWLVRQGHERRGAELLDRARAVYERLGAHRWLEKLDRRTSTRS